LNQQFFYINILENKRRRRWRQFRWIGWRGIFCVIERILL